MLLKGFLEAVIGSPYIFTLLLVCGAYLIYIYSMGSYTIIIKLNLYANANGIWGA